MAHHRHFDERLAATVAVDPVCARGEISHGCAIWTFGATASHPFLVPAILPLLEIM
jgi:hypothetical protein